MTTLPTVGGSRDTWGTSLNEILTQLLNTDTGYMIHPYKDVMAYGATGDGATDDATAIGTAFAALDEHDCLLFPADKTFVIESEINCAVPERCTILAHGAKFTSSTDGPMFNLNSAADASDTANTVKRMVRWFGGNFYNTAAAKTNSEALKLYCFRNMAVVDAYFEGWYKAINFDSLDNFKFHRNYFWNNYYGLFNNKWATDGTGLGQVTIYDCNFNMTTNNISGIYMEGDYSGVRIDSCSFAGTHERMIDLRNTDSTGNPTGISIRGCHFEQGINGDYYVFLDDTLGSRAFVGVAIENNWFQGGGPTAVLLERCAGVRFSTNRFSQTLAGGGTSISMDSACSDIHIDPSNYFSDAKPYWTCARREITLDHPIVPWNHNEFTGYNGDSFSTGTATIDMSSVISAVYPSIGAPKGYWVTMAARDSASAANNTWVRLAKNSGINSNLAVGLVLTGVTNDQTMYASGFVPCDDNGDIYIDYSASGTSTLDIWLTVTGIAM